MSPGQTELATLREPCISILYRIVDGWWPRSCGVVCFGRKVCEPFYNQIWSFYSKRKLLNCVL